MSGEFTHPAAKVAAVSGNPKHKSGAPVKVGDDVDKEAIDAITGGTIELDRAVAYSYRFPVAANARTIRMQPNFAPQPAPVRIAVEAPALPVEVHRPALTVGDAPPRASRRR